MLKLRAYLAVLVVSLGLLVSDVVQRTVIAPWVKLRPNQRVSVLGRWINLMASFTTKPLIRIGGARIQMPERIVPCGPGQLIIMNHQSVMDIPLLVRTVKGGYPRIVTRARYHRFIPLISHMVRLYQYPVVDPTANPREVLRSVRTMAREARDSDVPIGIFPEGTRTRNGEIGTFKRRGLSHLLKERPWTVHVFVVDGYWRTAKFAHLVAGLGHVDGRIQHVRSVEWNDPAADSTDFIEDLRNSMLEALAEMRHEPAAAREAGEGERRS